MPFEIVNFIFKSKSMLALSYEPIEVTKSITINIRYYVNNKKAVCKRNGVN